MLDYITELSAEQEEHERVVDDERYSENDLQEEKVCIASLLLLNGLLFILSSHWAVLENIRHRGGSTVGWRGEGCAPHLASPLEKSSTNLKKS